MSLTQCQECHTGLFHFYFAIRNFQDFSLMTKNAPWENRTNQKEWNRTRRFAPGFVVFLRVCELALVLPVSLPGDRPRSRHEEGISSQAFSGHRALQCPSRAPQAGHALFIGSFPYPSAAVLLPPALRIPVPRTVPAKRDRQRACDIGLPTARASPWPRFSVTHTGGLVPVS